MSKSVSLSYAKVVAAVACVALGVWIGMQFAGPGIAEANVKSAAGSANDPLVTKSYLDEQLSKLGQGGGSTGTAQELQVVSVSNGKTLVAAQGTEVIVRSGKAVIFSEDGNGVPDLTAGVDLAHGKSAPNNHLLLFPRDGRGITTASNTSAGLIVTVRGDFQIK